MPIDTVHQPPKLLLFGAELLLLAWASPAYALPREGSQVGELGQVR